MTVNWTPEPARATQPAHPRNLLAWTLWIASALALLGWGACMALGLMMDGRVHWLLALFAGLTLVHVLLGFRNVEYFVPLRLTGRWLRFWRPRYADGFGAEERGGRGLTPGASLEETLLTPEAHETVLPGNDPASGPGKRRPNPPHPPEEPR